MVPVEVDLEEEKMIKAGLWQTTPATGTLTGRRCPRCAAATLHGENHHHIATRLDVHPLDPAGELTAVLTARLTYRLWQPEPRTLIATRRWAPDITAHPANPTANPAHIRSGPHGTPTAVLATHCCHQPLSTHPLQLRPNPTADEASAGFPDHPTY